MGVTGDSGRHAIVIALGALPEHARVRPKQKEPRVSEQEILGACRRIRTGFERLFFRMAPSGCIDDKTDIACFAVFARRKNARSRADDGVF